MPQVSSSLDTDAGVKETTRSTSNAVMVRLWQSNATAYCLLSAAAITCQCAQVEHCS